MFVWNVCTTDRIKLIWTLILKISDKLLALPPHCNTLICRVCRQQIVPFKTVFIIVIYAKPTSNSRWDSPLNRHMQVIRLQQQACKLITAQFFLLLSQCDISCVWSIHSINQLCGIGTSKSPELCRYFPLTKCASWTICSHVWISLFVSKYIQIHRDIFMIACRFGGENWQFFDPPSSVPGWDWMFCKFLPLTRPLVREV